MKRRDFETLYLEVDDGVGTLTLNRPQQLNAVTPQTIADLLEVFDLTDADDEVKALIITGAGKAFCAGADLSRGAESFEFGNPDGGEVPRDGGGQVALRIYDSLKPVIAAINGAAVGVGVTMLLPADIRIASTAARFGFVFARRGIVPEATSTWFLPRIVGVSTALSWCFLGKLVAPEEALRRGLIESVHAPEDLLPAARAIAREIADNTAPVSIALTRQMLWKMLGADHPMEAHRIDSRAIVSRGNSTDASEGVASFLEKRAPRYRNRVSTDMPDFFPWWGPRRFS